MNFIPLFLLLITSMGKKLFFHDSLLLQNCIIIMFKKKTNKKTIIDTENIQLQDNEQDEDLKGEPKKRVKRQQPKSCIGSSTMDQKLNIQKDKNEKFQSLNYKAGQTKENNNEVLAGDDALQTETQLARKRYLENIQSTKEIREGKASSKMYRGQNNYANYQISENELANPLDHYKKKFGPQRASGTAMKNTCRFDYDRSLCKDWHDSGYCVFGNSCLYLHDRSNHKTGWQQEKDFEKAERERWKRINNPQIEQDEELKNIEQYKVQQKCEYCKEKFREPVQVECKHIFCMKCAMKMNEKEKKCIRCKKKVGGIMNNAEKVLKQKRQKYEDMVKEVQKERELKSTRKVDYQKVSSIDVFDE